MIPWLIIGAMVGGALILKKKTLVSQHPKPPASILQALTQAANKTGVPLPILIGVAHTESRYKPDLISPRGAQGLMQLLPTTATNLGVTNPFDPYQSALGGAKFLKTYYKVYGDWSKTLAAYNWGPGNVDKGNPWPASVQTYVKNVIG